jgi:hypothetical protein
MNKTIGIIDAELLAKGKHRFPNLAAMKLSGYHKQRGDEVFLLTDYRSVSDFDNVYVCCVFTKTAEGIPANVPTLPNVQRGGTGFFFAKAPPLPTAVEHSPPDYDLYHSWLQTQNPGPALKYYTDYSMGLLTRGCFRRCLFCINRNAAKAVQASPLNEFYDNSRKRVCLLDDNFLAFQGCDSLLTDLIRTCRRDGKSFEFKQGLDIRLLTPEVAMLLQQAPLCGEIIFAFDSIGDAAQIRRGLAMLRKYMPTKGGKGYLLCGFEDQTWRDIATVFRRLQILWGSKCLGYVMPHEKCRLASPFCRRIYTQLARWCNQPRFQKASSFREFCNTNGGKAVRTMAAFVRAYPDVAGEFFDMRYSVSSVGAKASNGSENAV